LKLFLSVQGHHWQNTLDCHFDGGFLHNPFFFASYLHHRITLSHLPAVCVPHEEDDDWQGLTSSLTSSWTLTSVSNSSALQGTSDGTLVSTSGATSGKFNSFAFIGSTLAGGVQASATCYFSGLQVQAPMLGVS